MAYPEPKMDTGFISQDPLKAFLKAIEMRRLGISAHWEIQGKRQSQYKRAASRCEEVVDLDEHN